MPFLRQALEIVPDREDALTNLGVALVALGELVEAETCYRRAIAAKRLAVVSGPVQFVPRRLAIVSDRSAMIVKRLAMIARRSAIVPGRLATIARRSAINPGAWQ